MSYVQASQDNSAYPKLMGRMRVLDMIRQNGAIARIDIAHQTGLSPATVTAITAELLELGLIEGKEDDAGAAPQKRGRPRTTLQIRAQALLVAGAKVSTDRITIVISDFLGKQVARHDYPLRQAQNTPQDLCRDIAEALAEGCGANDLALSDIAGAAVGLAGYVDGRTGFVHWSSSLTERGVAFGALLTNACACPVFLENDVNLVAKAEQIFGLGKKNRSFLVVTIEHGIGLGIVINGSLHRGTRGCGAEFGHIKMVQEGAPCQCGQTGCLEAYAGEYALIARADNASDLSISTFADFQGALDRKDVPTQHVLADAQQHFTVGLANLVNLFDPERIIIASKIGSDHPLCQADVLARIEDMVVQVDAPMPEIVVHGWGDLMWAKGAAAHALEEVSALTLRQIGER